STPAFASTSLNLPISVRSCSLGITPASESFVALTITMNRIVLSLSFEIRSQMSEVQKPLTQIVARRRLKSTWSRKKMRPHLTAEYGGWKQRLRLRQLRQPAFEKPPFRLLPRQLQGPLIGNAGLGDFSQPPTQVGPSRVSQIIVGQFAPHEDRLDQRQPRRGAVAHRHRHGTIQLDHGRRLNLNQNAIELYNLSPIGRGGCRC